MIPFHLEHIVARQHGGDDHLDKLAVACDRCNAFKGTNLTSVSTDTGEIIPLFHPRHDKWTYHFEWVGPTFVGLTEVGRVTVRLLNMNARRRVQLREEWMLATGEL